MSRYSQHMRRSNYRTGPRPFRPCFSGAAAAPVASLPPLFDASIDWARYWELIKAELSRHQYSRSTLRSYRHVLRRFASFTGQLPGQSTMEHFRAFLAAEATAGKSSAWLSSCISTLRTALDKLGGFSITAGQRTPRRGFHLPDILAFKDVQALLRSAGTIRDQLLLGLMAGSGLKPGEACALRWCDVDVEAQTVHVRFSRGTRDRVAPLPIELLPVLKEGCRRCPGEQYVFPGEKEGSHLTPRMADVIVRQAVAAAKIEGIVSCMTLRHTCAVYWLECGYTIRQVQEWLGHLDIETTLVYERMKLPKDAVSPLDNKPVPPAALFEKPLSVEGLDLPFQAVAPSTLDRINSYYQALRNGIGARFFSRRHPRTG